MASSQAIIDVCLLAGKLMLKNGAETYRVEDTMTRIAASYGIHSTHSFVTPTGIIFSIDGTEASKLVRISERTIDLEKVTVVNSISREISKGDISPEDALNRLREVEATSYTFPLLIQIIAASVASGCFLLTFLGKWHDIPSAMITGGVGFAVVSLINNQIKIKFFAEFLAALTVGLMSVFLVQIGIGWELDKIIISSVMPLVPGLHITNAVRDLIAGHLVSGITKGAEAFLTASAIGAGIAVVFSIL